MTSAGKYQALLVFLGIAAGIGKWSFDLTWTGLGFLLTYYFLAAIVLLLEDILQHLKYNRSQS
jgi:hypothetical protein